MTISILETVLIALKQSKLKPTFYSGRGMSGQYCLAFSCSNAKTAKAKLVRNNQELQSVVENAKGDTLGQQVIVYFPNVPLTYEQASELQ